jgi:hypothetical protein
MVAGVVMVFDRLVCLLLVCLLLVCLLARLI